MTLDHLREIALIQISQAQRTNAMTIIDTTLYANGALRLSRHGAGKGGNVLRHVPTGYSVEVTDARAEWIDRHFQKDWGLGFDAYVFFIQVTGYDRTDRPDTSN